MCCYVAHHLHLPNAPLFAYSTASRELRTLTKKGFLDKVNKIWAGLGNAPIARHTFWIGGTTKLL
jgi:hypothetical protein